MKRNLIQLSDRYATALRTHLKQGPQASLRPALRLGRQAVVHGLETLELARMHEQALVILKLPGKKKGSIGRAEKFFIEAIVPIVETHRAARQSRLDLHRLNGALGRRMAELAVTNRQLQYGIGRRRSVEAALRKSGEHYGKLLKDSLQLQESLRQLAHQVLAAQEDERKKISRELQDEIAQTLLGINVRLLSLKQEARVNTKGLRNEIANTRRLVVKSARSVRRVAREFRQAMKRKFSIRYQAALLNYLKRCPGVSLQPARGLGGQAQQAGLQTLELAKLHEHILITQVLPGRTAGKRAELIKQAGIFFTEAIIPVEKVHRGARAAAVHLNQIVEMLSQRTVELAASNLDLKQEIAQRKAVEAALKKSEHHYSQLLAQSGRLQEQLRQLSRQILLTQEEERREISRELHDVIAQTLTGINVRLAALAKEAAVNTQGLDQNIASTQRLVEKSVDIVHKFARELRPAVLDDLGLIPALHSFMKNFTTQTGVRTRLTAFAGVEQLDTTRRTVLFRIAQESLTNVARHAKASRVEISLQNPPGQVRMKIKDDGKSFSVEGVLNAKGRKRLGLLGMRERLDMVGGSFGIESSPGKGTTVMAQVPFGQPAHGKLPRKPPSIIL